MRPRPLRLALAASVVASALAATGGAGAHSRTDSPRLTVELPEAAAVALLPPARFDSRARGYDWPIRPFGRVHPIRGGFADPRFGTSEHNFHFGIDISAKPGAPVYAVAPGTVYLYRGHVDVLADGKPGEETGFSYWHIDLSPKLVEHSFVKRHTLLGRVDTVWKHVHFGELEHGFWVNPLRPGALRPSTVGRPEIRRVFVAPTAAGTATPEGLSGRVVVVTEAYVAAAEPPPSPWQNAHFAPARIRWRLLAAGEPVSRWTDAVDFRRLLPANRLFRNVYTRGTLQNKRDRPGTYLFYLARDWDLDRIPPGAYTIEVEAYNIRGAVATASTDFTVAAPAESVEP